MFKLGIRKKKTEILNPYIHNIVWDENTSIPEQLFQNIYLDNKLKPKTPLDIYKLPQLILLKILNSETLDRSNFFREIP